MDKEEKKLVSLAINGDISAFEQLIQSHQKKVYNIALRMMRNQEDAKELAQEAFIKAFKYIKKFKGNSSFSTWIYRITMNVCNDELRKRKSANVIHIEYYDDKYEKENSLQLTDESESPSDNIERKELRDNILVALDKLNHEHKKVIVLRDIQGMNYKEIANIVGVTEGTIKSRINRARKKLREYLIKDTELFNNYVVKNNISKKEGGKLNG